MCIIYSQKQEAQSRANMSHKDRRSKPSIKRSAVLRVQNRKQEAQTPLRLAEISVAARLRGLAAITIEDEIQGKALVG